MAVSSGASGLEAAAVVTAGDEPGKGPERAGIGAARDLGGLGVPVFVAGPDLAVRQTLTT